MAKIDIIGEEFTVEKKGGKKENYRNEQDMENGNERVWI